MKYSILIRPFFALLMLAAGSAAFAQTAGNWTRQIPRDFPIPRYGHILAYDSGHSQIVLFGGVGQSQALLSGPYNDTWVWDGTTWIQKTPQTPPSARAFPAMAYDSAHAQVVLFGGSSFIIVPNIGITIFNDTWVWDGAAWTQKSPANSPPARSDMAMAYDSAHGQVVLFGGRNLRLSTLYNDTWVWDGTNWTQRSPKTSPPARIGHVMAYDSARGQVVLFGGLSDTSLNDTWVWDGTNWTQKSPPTSPKVRSYAAMAYDSAHGQTVLFGGASGAGRFNDTWTWDGANWTQQSPQTSPTPRTGPAAYDSAHNQVLVFGGSGESGGDGLGDTWTFTGAASQPTISAVISAGAYGGFSSVAPGSWVEIYGSNLSFNTRPWGGSDFNGNNAPTSLDGVQVTIGGQKAFVDYISGMQVNALLPSGIGTGPQQLTVTNGSVTSAPFTVTVNATEAGLLAPAAFKLGGNQYVVAQTTDGAYVLPAGSIAGVNSRQAQPGETIVIYGVGFGPVVPNTPAGQVASGTSQLAASLQILFDQAAADVPYAGLTPGLVGLYQFNIVVPDVPDNDLVPLTFNLGGSAGTQTLYTAVHR